MKYGAVVGVDRLKAARLSGFDFVEIPISRVLSPSSPDGDYEVTRRALVGAAIRVEAGNSFFPADLKVIGPDVDFDAVSSYTQTALARAGGLAIEVAVFGSGASRAIPSEFPREQAVRQLDELLRMMGDAAQPRGIAIAIEPLNTRECNWINSVAEARAIVTRLGHPAVKILADIYHISAEKEGFHGVLDAGSDVAHIHVSSADRGPPRPDGADWVGLFRALKALGYDSRLSMECRWDDFAAQAPAALDFLKTAWEEAF